MINDSSLFVFTEVQVEDPNGQGSTSQAAHLRDWAIGCGWSTQLKQVIYCHTFDRVRFIWDRRKASANLRKHGVSFEEAASAFDDPLGAYYPDSLHEDRFIVIGYSLRHRLLFVVYAEVTGDTIRIISARKATNDEKTRYEND